MGVKMQPDAMKTDNDNYQVRLTTPELQSQPVPRWNRAEERVFKLIREREGKPVFESLGANNFFFCQIQVLFNPVGIADSANDSDSN